MPQDFLSPNDSDEPDYDELDPGIREVVRLLRKHHFDTTDSGDGVSKDADPGEVLDYPHVHVFVRVPQVQRYNATSRTLDVQRAGFAVTGAHRLFDVLRGEGVSFHYDHYDDPTRVPLIQMYYGYPDGACTISLINVNDDLLARARRGEFSNE